jgi:micrococcal nuclease
MLRILLTISLVINALLGIFFLRPRPVSPNLYEVDRVIDGDTFVLTNNQQIRLMSVNAPEVGLCGSSQATDTLKSLIDGKKVRLEGDLNDHFGRFLALVYVDDQLVNKEMILSGWPVSPPPPPPNPKI